MTKAEQRKQRRLRRSSERKKRRMDKYVVKIQEAIKSNSPKELGLSRSKYDAVWPDSNSPTGYMQICDYQGYCQHPCNGDC